MYNATVTRFLKVTDDLFRIWVKPDEPFKPFLSGQYVALGLLGSSPRPANCPPEKAPVAPDKIIKRAYSIASSPVELDALELFIAVVSDGSLSPRLALLKEGDRLFVASKITGAFTLQGVPEDKNLIMISTGTGLAPFICMLRTPEVLSVPRHITVAHGVRHSPDFGYIDELNKIQHDSGGKITYIPMVSREDPVWQGRRGRVTKLLTDGSLDLTPQKAHVFLCGSGAMIEEVQKYLVERGFEEHTPKKPGNLHIEKY